MYRFYTIPIKNPKLFVEIDKMILKLFEWPGILPGQATQCLLKRLLGNGLCCFSYASLFKARNMYQPHSNEAGLIII